METDMASFKYFSDLNGETVELVDPHGLDNAKFASSFPGIKGRKYDSFQRLVGYRIGTKELLPVSRSIERPGNPSNHKCDARCLNARGFKCECSCGGKNHGSAGFMCLAA
jgi:hypothetical protein